MHACILCPYGLGCIHLYDPGQAVFSLLESMFKRLAGFAPSLQPLLEEVLTCVYMSLPTESFTPDAKTPGGTDAAGAGQGAGTGAGTKRESTDAAGGAAAAKRKPQRAPQRQKKGRATTPRSKARISPLEETAVTIKRLLNGVPYFVVARDLQLRVHSLEVATALNKRQGLLTNLRDAFFTRMSARHNKALKWAVRISSCVFVFSFLFFSHSCRCHGCDARRDPHKYWLAMAMVRFRFSSCGSNRRNGLANAVTPPSSG